MMSSYVLFLLKVAFLLKIYHFFLVDAAAWNFKPDGFPYFAQTNHILYMYIYIATSLWAKFL